MEYTDEKIIATKMEQKCQIPMSLEDGYYMEGVRVGFMNTVLFESKISLALPDTFVDMPLQIQELKYPSTFRPQIIKTNLGCDVNFAFSILDNPDGMTEKEIANNFCATLTRINPSIQIYDLSVDTTKGGTPITFFNFTSYGVDQPLFNFMGLAVEQGKIIQCIFNCLERSQHDWQNAAREVFLSMEIHDLK